MRSAQTMGAVHLPLAAACHESHSQQEQPAEDTPVQSTRWEDSRRWEVGERASTLWPHVTNHPLNIPKQQPPSRVGKAKLGRAKRELDLTQAIHELSGSHTGNMAIGCQPLRLKVQLDHKWKPEEI